MTEKNRGSHTTNTSLLSTQTQQEVTQKVRSWRINKHTYMTNIDMYVGWEMGEGGEGGGEGRGGGERERKKKKKKREEGEGVEA